MEVTSESCVLVVQARSGSTRLKKKMSRRLGSYKLIEWVLFRALKSAGISEFVLATTELEEDDWIEALAKELGFRVVRGSVNDVFSRFFTAIEGGTFSAVVRVCADNPFVDPSEVSRLIATFNSKDMDYCFNHRPLAECDYPDGFGAEIFSVTAFKKISQQDLSASEKEHVTQYFWNHSSNFRLHGLKAPTELAFPSLKFDIDTENDFEYLDALVAKGVSIESDAKSIADLARSLL